MNPIPTFITGEYKIERQFLDGGYVNGIWQPGPKKSFMMKGSLQPMTERDLQLLEEGERVKQTYKFYSNDQLFTGREGASRMPDRVCINGEWFRVHGTERWDGTFMPYFKSILVRESSEKEPNRNVG